MDLHEDPYAAAAAAAQAARKAPASSAPPASAPGRPVYHEASGYVLVPDGMGGYCLARPTGLRTPASAMPVASSAARLPVRRPVAASEEDDDEAEEDADVMDAVAAARARRLQKEQAAAAALAAQLQRRRAPAAAAPAPRAASPLIIASDPEDQDGEVDSDSDTHDLASVRSQQRQQQQQQQSQQPTRRMALYYDPFTGGYYRAPLQSEPAAPVAPKPAAKPAAAAAISGSRTATAQEPSAASQPRSIHVNQQAQQSERVPVTMIPATSRPTTTSTTTTATTGAVSSGASLQRQHSNALVPRPPMEVSLSRGPSSNLLPAVSDLNLSYGACGATARSAAPAPTATAAAVTAPAGRASSRPASAAPMLKSQAARTIQRWFRGWRLWRHLASLQGLVRAAAELREAAAKFYGFMAATETNITCRQAAEVNELAMRLIFKLDSMEGMPAEFRALRKHLVGRAMRLQDEGQAAYAKSAARPGNGSAVVADADTVRGPAAAAPAAPASAVAASAAAAPAAASQQEAAAPSRASTAGQFTPPPSPRHHAHADRKQPANSDTDLSDVHGAAAPAAAAAAAAPAAPEAAASKAVPADASIGDAEAEGNCATANDANASEASADGVAATTVEPAAAGAAASTAAAAAAKGDVSLRRQSSREQLKQQKLVATAAAAAAAAAEAAKSLGPVSGEGVAPAGSSPVGGGGAVSLSGHLQRLQKALGALQLLSKKKKKWTAGAGRAGSSRDRKRQCA
eukprot:XP_001697564.1 predicted protein [Chlamydomonas reinhardtii]